MVPIICDGFHQPDETGINNIPQVWTEEQRSTLMSFGISVNLVKEAYRYILALESLTMPQLGSAEQQEAVVVSMITRCRLPLQMISEKARVTNSPRVIITGNVADAESLSTCMVMKSLMQKVTGQETKVIRNRVHDCCINCCNNNHWVLVVGVVGCC